jgi:hypothetical protein
MARFWQYSLPSFDIPSSFKNQTEKDVRRREILFEVARRGDIMSYYELYNLPTDEVVAMAIEQESVAEKHKVAHKKTPIGEMGEMADGYSPNEGVNVYTISDDPSYAVTKLVILAVSDHGYLIKTQNIHKQELVLATKTVFGSEEVAEFMRREILVYAESPDIRR